MKTYSSKSASEKTETTAWEAFVEYMNTVYFEGAAEILDKELVCFEYEAYKSCYGN